MGDFTQQSDIFSFNEVFVNMGPNGNNNFKMLLLQITAQTFQTLPNCFSQWSSQNYVIFEMLKIEI